MLKKYISITICIMIILMCSGVCAGAASSQSSSGSAAGTSVTVGKGYGIALYYDVSDRDFGDVCCLMRVVNTAGTERTKTFSKQIKVNGESYNAEDAIELLNENYCGVPLEYYINNNGEIYSINADNECKSYSSVVYNEKAGRFSLETDLDVPIFGTDYFNDYCQAYLKEGYVYDISVFKYGIVVEWYESSVYEDTITYIDINTSLSADMDTYDLYVEADTYSGEYSGMHAKLYTAAGSLVDEVMSYSNSTTFTELPNEDCDYYAEVHFLNIDSHEEVYQSSDKQTAYFSISEREISYAMILDYGTSYEDFFGASYLVKCVNDKGEEKVYQFASKLYFNGRYIAAESAFEYMDNYLTACFALNDEGKITNLNVAEFESKYYEVTYNEETKSFNGVAANTSGIPVYNKKSNGDFDEAILTEEYLYDIKVSSYGVMIMYMESLVYSDTITDVFSEVRASYNLEMQEILVKAETLNSPLGMCGNLYDEEGNFLLSSWAYCFDEVGTVRFEDLPNEDKNYILEIYFTDEDKNQVSDKRVLQVSTAKHDVFSGVIADYADTSSDFGEISYFLLIIDDDGEEYVYRLDDYLYVNGNLCESCEFFKGLDETGEILVRFSLNSDGEIGAILFDSVVVQMIGASYSGKDLECCIYVEELVGGCYVVVAAYDDEGALCNKQNIYEQADKFKSDWNLKLSATGNEKFIKVMFMKDISSLVPACEALITSIK